MKKLSTKKVLAITMATMMTIGSSVTVLAATEATGNISGTSSCEGNAVGFSAPSVTVPTLAAATYTYIADPNGLIAESNSSRYADAEWAPTAKGIFFQTETGKYSEKSAAIEITNESAYALDVTVTLEEVSEKKAKNITYTEDSTFKDSTDKQVYFALTTGKTTAIMKTGDTATNAELGVTIAGKPSNYELTWNGSTSTYEYTAVANPTWNKTSVVAVGYLNPKAEWISGTGDAEIVFPALKVTYSLSAGAAPVKIADGAPATVNLTKKGASLTISKIAFGTTEVPTAMYETATAATAEKGTVLTLKSAFTTYAYSRTPADGLNFTVTYNDGSQETFTTYKK